MRKIILNETNNEIFLEDNEELISTTDLRGVLQYANDNFCRVSGYDRDELIGKNHNLVRHSSMPKETFEDLWICLKNGTPWRGAVKNRCKNGSFYWVDAFVTPLSKNGKIIGYQSVRKKLNEKERNRAEHIYSKLNNNKSITKKIPEYFLLILLFFISSFSTYFFNYHSFIPFISIFFMTLYSCHLIHVKNSFNEKMKKEYDSISRYIYLDKPDNISEYQILIINYYNTWKNKRCLSFIC